MLNFFIKNNLITFKEWTELAKKQNNNIVNIDFDHSVYQRIGDFPFVVEMKNGAKLKYSISYEEVKGKYLFRKEDLSYLKDVDQHSKEKEKVEKVLSNAFKNIESISYLKEYYEQPSSFKLKIKLESHNNNLIVEIYKDYINYMATSEDIDGIKVFKKIKNSIPLTEENILKYTKLLIPNY